MNWLDLVLLLTLAWFTIAGVATGAVREALTLASMLAGVVLAGLFYGALADDVDLIVSSGHLSRVIAFAVIFLAVFGAGQIAAIVLRGVVHALALGPLDRVGGLLFGLLKGVVVIEAALFLFARYQFNAIAAAMESSLLAPVFLRGVPLLLALLPHEFRVAVEQFPAVYPG